MCCCANSVLRAVFTFAIWTIALTRVHAEICDSSEELLSTTPAPPTTAFLWQLYLKELQTEEVDADLLLLGDSLAQLWPSTSLSPLRIANLGVSGDRTQQVLWRLASPELVKFNPHKVLIVIGSNNLAMNGAPCAIVSGIKKIIERVKEIWPRTEISFLEIPPRRDFGLKNDERIQINAAMRQSNGFKTINIDDAITCQWHTPCGYYKEDEVHFTEIGYQLVGQIIKSTLFPN
jgi:lysophospholipase L1-like esterase